MSTDLYERLADYRLTLNEAIVADLASRDASRPNSRPSPRRRLVLAASVAVIVAGGIGALAWANADRSASTADPVALGPDSSSDATVMRPAPDATQGAAVLPPSDAPAPSARIDRLAVGDSVMVGAAPLLADQGFAVDAIVSRRFHDVLSLVRTLRAEQRLGEVVVIQLGYNSPIDPDDLPQLMDALAEVPRVLLLTVDVPAEWAAPNNAVIREAAVTYPNVSVLDWEILNDECPGACFYDDGVHLRPDGQQYYVDLISAAINDG